MDKGQENFDFIDRARLKHDLGESRSCFKEHIYAYYKPARAYGSDVYDASNYLRKGNEHNANKIESRFLPREKQTLKERAHLYVSNPVILWLSAIITVLSVISDDYHTVGIEEFLFHALLYFSGIFIFVVVIGYYALSFIEEKFNVVGLLTPEPAPLKFEDGYTADFFLSMKQSNEALEQNKYNLDTPDKLFGLTIPVWNIYTTSSHYCRYPVDEFMKLVLYYKQLKVFIYFGVPGFSDESGKVNKAVMPFLGKRLKDEFETWCDEYVQRHGKLFAAIYALSECGIQHSDGGDAREYYRKLLKKFLSQVEYDVQQELCQYVFLDRDHLLIGSAYRNLYNDRIANDVRSFKHYWQQRGWDYAYLGERQRFEHQYVIGRTGAGKTYLLRNQIVQDIHAGHGVVLLTPERGLVDKVLSFVPDNRKNDVVVFDPSDSASPVVGFNLFDSVEPSQLTFRVGEITAILERSLGDLKE